MAITEDAGLADTHAWLAEFLRAGAEDASGRARLAQIAFTDIVTAIEHSAEATDGLAAIRLYQHWIFGQPAGNPHLFAAWFNLGVALSRAGDKQSAMVAYQTTLGIRPDFHAAATNLGLLLEALGQPDAALRTWEQALQTDDARTTLLNQRARLLEQLQRLDLAEQEMRRSLLINPKQPDVIQHWVHIRQKMCAWPALSDAIPGLSPEDLSRHLGPLSAMALTDDIQAQSLAAADWINRHTSPATRMLSPAEGYRHDRLRIGYMSSDFCRHAMSYLIAELFERHDRERFEIFGYCSSPNEDSDIRARIIGAFDRFRIIKHLSDEAAARTIREDEIDILVDLNGLTAGARPQILRWKPAPVQTTYLGFVGPVPLPELDFLFCDDIVVPPDLASAYSPVPHYIAPNYQANDTRRKIGDATTRAAADLPDDKFVFCCFSNHYKVTEELYGAWMTILRRAENAVLWLAGDNEWARRDLLERAADLGVDPDRIIFAQRCGPDEYMARLALPDLFLDTFPYNAGTIASDAIRMGLPLVTISGRAFSSRMASRLLQSVGGDLGITTSIPEYIDTAVSLATDRPTFEAFKSKFHVEAWSRQIGDIASFTAAYEQSLQAIAKRDRG